MARRVMVGQEVPKVELVLGDGRIYVWEMSMYTVKMMAEEAGGFFDYYEGLRARMEGDPLGTLGELLYFGLHAEYPELTREDILRMFPASAEMMEAIVGALVEAGTAGLSEDAGANPRTPGAAATGRA